MTVQARAPLPLLLVTAWLGFAVACGSRSPTAPDAVSPAPTPSTLAIMGSSRLRADQIVAWFNGRQPRPPATYVATVPLEAMATIFIEEGAAEGVAGDIAFMQSVVETGWFRFSGSIPASSNNFAGIGATDTNPAPAIFPDARTGVRAQIQHLRAYADASAVTCTVPPLRNPCVDPRFALVLPKGKAPTWNQMGNGNWATATTYASSILTLYAEARAFSESR
ncbi:MAG TPA: glucosaminidase domain-containing protein [Vicinamibacterales bacterium]|nr:glucosaminidase domain-containing protein [Vicinamibacterales bacterium]